MLADELAPAVFLLGVTDIHSFIRDLCVDADCPNSSPVCSPPFSLCFLFKAPEAFVKLCCCVFRVPVQFSLGSSFQILAYLFLHRL